MKSVEPNNLAGALAHIANGGRLAIQTYTRLTIISADTVAKFSKAGAWLLREEGRGYRLRQGKGSVFILPGQLKYID